MWQFTNSREEENNWTINQTRGVVYRQKLFFFCGSQHPLIILIRPILLLTEPWSMINPAQFERSCLSNCLMRYFFFFVEYWTASQQPCGRHTASSEFPFSATNSWRGSAWWLFLGESVTDARTHWKVGTSSLTWIVMSLLHFQTVH